MFFIQVMLMALRGLRANLLRSLLTMLGVIIGVGAVISAMSILEGSQRDIVERFESMGSETITVYPATARVGGRAVGIMQTLTVQDADWIGDPRKCPSVAVAAPEVHGGSTIKYFNRNEDVTVLGTNEKYAEMFSYKVTEGRFLTRDDVNTDQKVVVLGYKTAKDLFGNRPAINVPVKIKGVPFRVIGVMEKKGDIGFRTVDTQIIVPVTTAMKRLFGMRFVNSITVQAADSALVDKASAEIKRELRRRHDIRIRHGQKDDFEIFSQEETRKQLSEV
ncbi:MAG: ABC transporter permease, partial [Planctomycetota bacterium]